MQFLGETCLGIKAKNGVVIAVYQIFLNKRKKTQFNIN